MIKDRTSGLIGCPASSITIKDVKGGTFNSSYTAICKGKVYYCSGKSLQDMQCTKGN